jgi:hypothetical protein
MKQDSYQEGATMKVSAFLLVIALFVALPVIQAGTVTFTVSDTLGPVITTDPLGVSGSPFTLTGTVTEGSSPSGVATYAVDSLSVTGTVSGATATLTACGTPGAPSECVGTITPTLTLTTDSATLSFDIYELVVADLSATITLPPGTFEDSSGTVSLENVNDAGVTGCVSAADCASSLTYSQGVPGKVPAEVGISSATATVTGFVPPTSTTPPPPPPSTVPEPANILLLSGGLIGLAIQKRLRAR